MAKKLAALIACGILFGGASAQAQPMTDARLKDLLKSNLTESQTLETLRSRDRKILEDLGAALNAKYGKLLSGSEMVFSRLVEDGTVFYRMDFVNLKNKDHARALCELLEMDRCVSIGGSGQMAVLDIRGGHDRELAVTGVIEDLRPFSYSVPGLPEKTFNPEAREIEASVRAMLDPLGVYPLRRPDFVGRADARGPASGPEQAAARQALDVGRLVETAGPMPRPDLGAMLAGHLGRKTSTAIPEPVRRPMPRLQAALSDLPRLIDGVPLPKARPDILALLEVSIPKPMPRPVFGSLPREGAEAELAVAGLDVATETAVGDIQPFAIDVIEYFDDAPELAVPDLDEGRALAPAAEFPEPGTGRFAVQAPELAQDIRHDSPVEILAAAPQVMDEAPRLEPAGSQPFVVEGWGGGASAREAPVGLVQVEGGVIARHVETQVAALPAIDRTTPVAPLPRAPEVMDTLVAGGDFDVVAGHGLSDSRPAAAASVPSVAPGSLPRAGFLEIAEGNAAGFFEAARAGNRGLVVSSGAGKPSSGTSGLAISLPGIGKVDTAKLKTHAPRPSPAPARVNGTMSLAEQAARPASETMPVPTRLAPSRLGAPTEMAGPGISFEVPRPIIQLAYVHVPRVTPERRAAALDRIEDYQRAEEARLFAQWLESLPEHGEKAVPLRRADVDLQGAIAVAEARRVAAEEEALRVAEAKAAAEEEARRVAAAQAAEEAEARRIAEAKAAADAEARRVAEAEAAAEAEALRIAEAEEKARVEAIAQAEARAAEAEENRRLAEVRAAEEAEEARLAQAEAARLEQERLAELADAVQQQKQDQVAAAARPGAMLVSELTVEYTPDRNEIMDINPVMPDPFGGTEVDQRARIDAEAARAELAQRAGRDIAAPRRSLLGMVAFDDRYAVPSLIDFSGGKDAGRLQKLPQSRPDLTLLGAKGAWLRAGITGQAPGGGTMGETLERSFDLAQVPGGIGVMKQDAPSVAVEPSEIDKLLELRIDEVPFDAEVEPMPEPEAADLDTPFSADQFFGANDAQEEAAPQPAPSIIPAPSAAPVAVAPSAAPMTRADEATVLDVLDQISRGGGTRPGLQPAAAAPVPATAVAAEPVQANRVQVPSSEMARPPRQPDPVAAHPAQRVDQRTAEPMPRISAPAPQPGPGTGTAVPGYIERQPMPQYGNQDSWAAPRALTPAEQLEQDRAAAQAQARSMTGAAVPRYAERSVTTYNAADLRIELSYVGSREAVLERVNALKSYFPPAMLSNGRFYGASVSGQPNSFVVGIEAHDYGARDNLIWYLDRMQIPWVIK